MRDDEDGDGLQGERTTAPARVIAERRGRWLVETEEGDRLLLPARGRLRRDGVSPVVGDRVTVEGGATIAAVLPRGGTIVRRHAGREAAGQVLAANVDVAVLADALPTPNLRRLERFAALAAAGGVRILVVLTKADRDPDHAGTAARVARRLGTPDVVAVSSLDGTGMDALGAALRAGTTAVLLGPSGAGKSTLVNALLGDDRRRTAPVRATDDRGRHTTVGRELIVLPSGAYIIDTPGIREVGMWDDGTGAAFAEIAALATRCRFSDCTHDTEPGCAVRDAVPPERLDSWRTLRREEAWIDDRRAASRARDQWGKRIAKARRAIHRGEPR